MASEKYRDFSMKLLPGINGEKVLGVSVPDIKSLAKEAVRQGGYESFLKQNHCYVEEVTLGVKSRSTEQRSILRFVFEMVEFGRRLHRPLCDSAAAELLP